MPGFGDLTPDKIARLQRIADEYGEPIGVFGSAARGTRVTLYRTLKQGFHRLWFRNAMEP